MVGIVVEEKEKQEKRRPFLLDLNAGFWVLSLSLETWFCCRERVKK